MPKKFKKSATVSAMADSSVGRLRINVFDGTRELMKTGTPILLTVRDGAQNEHFRDFVAGPTIDLTLPFHNNFADQYSIVASSDGYQQAGFAPVLVAPPRPQTLDLMLLKKDGDFHFANAKWTDIQAKKPQFARIFAATGEADDFGLLLENHPDQLACLLNLATAMEQIFLPSGTPLDYCKQFDLPHLTRDRAFAYADAKLVEQVKQAAQQGEFAVQPAADLTLHGDATSSFKQVQFGEANLQLTFHETNRRKIDGVDCVYVEPDMDYFKDPGSHLLLEVIPNRLSGTLSDPRTVYVLRWIAGRRAGVPNFDPLYTIE